MFLSPFFSSEDLKERKKKKDNKRCYTDQILVNNRKRKRTAMNTCFENVDLFQCEHCIYLVQFCPQETPGECRKRHQASQAQRNTLTGPTSNTYQLLRSPWRTRSDSPPVQCPFPQANFRPFSRRGHVCCSMMDFLTVQHV